MCIAGQLRVYTFVCDSALSKMKNASSVILICACSFNSGSALIAFIAFALTSSFLTTLTRLYDRYLVLGTFYLWNLCYSIPLAIFEERVRLQPLVAGASRANEFRFLGCCKFFNGTLEEAFCTFHS